MDAAPQLVHCGIEPVRFSVNNNCFIRNRVPVRRRNGPVLAVATEPKPPETGPAKPSRPGTVNGSSRSPPLKSVNGVSSRMGEVSQEIKRMRAQMEEDEQLAILMKGLRGQNLSDSQFAEDDVQLRLVEVDESSEFLPLVYDPSTISAYWEKRPRAVATRIVQLLSVAGGFLSRLGYDFINKKVKENEVARAIELREIVTSLGPAYIKLGQALSIRPDILSPAAMTELQKLCDKRLLTDESPRLRSALRYTIYGKSGVFDAERFIDVMQAFENFITAAKSGGGESLNGDMAELGILQGQSGNIIPASSSSNSEPVQPVQTRAALAFLLSDKGNFFREFLLDEIVKGIDAVTREQLVQVMAFLGVGNAAPVFSMVPALGPFKPAALLPTVTEEDRIILNNVQTIVEFLTAGSSISRTSNESSVDVARAIRELLPVLPGISAKVLPEILSRLSSRVAARIIRDTFL